MNCRKFELWLLSVEILDIPDDLVEGSFCCWYLGLIGREIIKLKWLVLQLIGNLMSRIERDMIGFVIGFGLVDEISTFQQQFWRSEDVLIFRPIVRG